MEIKIQKTLLENVIGKSISFVDLKDNSNITSNIKICAFDEIVTVDATDYDIGLTSTLKGIITIKNGFSIVNGKKMLDIIKSMKNDFVNISSDGKLLHIKQGRSKFKIPVFSESFPSIPYVESPIEINISSDVLSDSFNKILNCVDTNNPKYEFNGALVQIDKDKVQFIGTDTKRLSIVNMDNQSDTNISIILPKRSIIEMQKLFFDDIKILCNDVYMTIESDRFRFFTRLINGKFPDVTRVIPKEVQYTADINKSQLNDGIKQILTVSSEIEFCFKKDTLTLKSVSNDDNNAISEFNIQSNLDESFTTKLNSKFVLDFIKSINTESFAIGLTSEGMPLLFQSENLRTVIMPIV